MSVAFLDQVKPLRCLVRYPQHAKTLRARMLNARERLTARRRNQIEIGLP